MVQFVHEVRLTIMELFLSYVRRESNSYGKHTLIKYNTFIHSLLEGWEAWKAGGEMTYREI